MKDVVKVRTSWSDEEANWNLKLAKDHVLIYMVLESFH